MSRDQIEKARYDHIDLLRGIAACSVAWLHIVQNNPAVIQDGRLASLMDVSSKYGFLGVPVFFILSGFIIPHSMASCSYRLSDYPRFLLKRLLRLQLPFYASLLLALAVAFAAPLVPGFCGEPPRFSVAQLLAHIAYLNPITGHEWILGVYWSLAVEFQFYLIIGMLMPVFLGCSFKWIACTLLLLDCAPFCFANWSSFPYHAPFFVLGLLLWLLSCQRVTLQRFIVLLSLTLALIAAQRSPPYLISSLLVLPIFLWKPKAAPVFVLLGLISYSIYLVHYVVGMRALRLLVRFADSDTERLLAYLGSFALTIAFSTAFYWMFERPSLKLSSKVRFGRHGRQRGDASPIHRTEPMSA